METAANMALLWGRSYRADNVMDHCLDRVRGSGWGCCGGAGLQADRRGWWELVGGVKKEKDADGRLRRRVVLQEE